MKEYDRILEAERLERLHKGGQLVIETDFRWGDARELLHTIPPESIDLIIWDPPYGIAELEAESNENRSGKIKEADNLSPKEAINLFMEITELLVAVMKPGAHFYIFFSFHNYYDLVTNLRLAGLEVSDVPIIWDKQASTTVFKGYNFMSAYEPILFGYKPPRTKRLAEPCKNIIQCKGVPKKEKLHAFEKPLDLLTRFIKQSSNLGDIVFDPTAGSAAVLAAALQVGRNPVGFELDKEHYVRGLSRLQDEKEFLEEQTNA